jgi:glycosyltransferase involved in cell wall biosynthesis
VLWRPVRDHRTKIPTKFYEYLQEGLPIICSDIPLWRDFVERHACGVAVDPGDSDHILDLIQEWVAQPSLYTAMSASALRASAQYNWESAAERLLEAYSSLLASR